MHTEVIAGKKCIIGKGENVVKKCLERLFPEPKYRISQQRSIKDFLSIGDYEFLDEIHQKSTIDIVISEQRWRSKNQFVKEPYDVWIFVRVQGQDHKGKGKSGKDHMQKKYLEKYGQVVDILWYEALNVFKDKLTWETMKEVITAFQMAEVVLDV